jgi:hypothetical protein
LRMPQCVRRFILNQGQRMKHFVSLSLATELAEVNSWSRAVTISHSFHTIANTAFLKISHFPFFPLNLPGFIRTTSCVFYGFSVACVNTALYLKFEIIPYKIASTNLA